jgi:hypothetical protein
MSANSVRGEGADELAAAARCTTEKMVLPGPGRTAFRDCYPVDRTDPHLDH